MDEQRIERISDSVRIGEVQRLFEWKPARRVSSCEKYLKRLYQMPWRNLSSDLMMCLVLRSLSWSKAQAVAPAHFNRAVQLMKWLSYEAPVSSGL